MCVLRAVGYFQAGDVGDLALKGHEESFIRIHESGKRVRVYIQNTNPRRCYVLERGSGIFISSREHGIDGSLQVEKMIRRIEFKLEKLLSHERSILFYGGFLSGLWRHERRWT